MGSRLKNRGCYQPHHHVDYEHDLDPEDDEEMYEEADAMARIVECFRGSYPPLDMIEAIQNAEKILKEIDPDG